MNCSFNTNKTTFLVVESLKNISMARQFCEKNGYRLGSIHKEAEQKIPQVLESCNIFQYQFIADQDKDDGNLNCFFLYQKQFGFSSFEKQLTCDNFSHFMFLCSKSVKRTQTTSLSTNTENGSNSFMITTISTVLGVMLFIAFLTWLIRKKFKVRRNPTENIEMQPIASTSANMVCYEVENKVKFV